MVELVVDGVFAMDSAYLDAERALAALALDAAPRRAGRDVVVGGLGLGYTASEALADPSVGSVRVVELHGALVEWFGAGLLPGLGPGDPRLTVEVGDVLRVVPALPHPVDALLLDVDNGPGFLVHEPNAAVYAPPFLTAAAGRLRPGGVLAVWSADPSPALAATLAAAVGPTEEVLLAVRRDGRDLTYAIYLARRCA